MASARLPLPKRLNLVLNLMMARPRGPKRSKKVIAEAVKRYMANEPVDDIAKDIGVTQPTVSYWMKRYGKLFGNRRFRLRTQGRRKNLEPCDRDKQILFLHSLGVPAAKIAREYGFKSRARASFIIKTWRERGYTPQAPPYAVGDIVRFAGVADYRLDEITDNTRGVATLLAEYIPTEDRWHYVEKGVVSNPFYFYRDGQLAEVIQKGQSVPAWQTSKQRHLAWNRLKRLTLHLIYRR